MEVNIFSFSYRKGYPKDLTEHGGGFIFDTRLLNNPGIKGDLMQLTGKDEEVIRELEANNDAVKFFGDVSSLVDLAISNYLARDYTYLSVGFGCTGGRHRSVYMAEKLGKHLMEKFPAITVKVNHNEGH